MTLSCGCDDNYAVLDRTSTPMARKEYICQECGKAILKGAVYYRRDFLYEGKWGCTKTCEACGDLGESMASLGFCWNIGELAEAHREYIREYAPPAIAMRYWRQ